MLDLRPPCPLDVRRTFWWLQDEALATSFMISEKPRRSTHFAYWRRVLDGSADGKFYAIDHHGTHIGNCGLKKIEGEAAELWIYIGSRQDRGAGAGKLATRALIEMARQRSISRLHLFVRADNHAAIGLYRSSGFSETLRTSAGKLGFNADVEMIRMEARI